jgi:hypothetical protein
MQSLAITWKMRTRTIPRHVFQLQQPTKNGAGPMTMNCGYYDLTVTY